MRSSIDLLDDLVFLWGLIMNSTKRPAYHDMPRSNLLAYIPTGLKTVLDVGCNKGAFGKALKSLGDVEVWGVEPDSDSARVAAERLDHVINDFFSPDNPLPDRYFDLIAFNDSLEHMGDPVAALELCRQKLKRPGRIHCCVPNVRHIENLEHLLIEKDWQYEETGVRDRTHLRFFTKKSITALFEQSGYKIISVFGINESWWGRDKILRRVFFRMFPTVTDDMRYTQFLLIAELS